MNREWSFRAIQGIGLSAMQCFTAMQTEPCSSAPGPGIQHAWVQAFSRQQAALC
jgi:hypothetical protein